MTTHILRLMLMVSAMFTGIGIERKNLWMIAAATTAWVIVGVLYDDNIERKAQGK